MAYTVNESYRFKKMASFARTCSTVLDVGCAQLPNEYLQNPSVTGVDINKGNLTSNYHHFIQGEVGDLMTNKEQYDGVIAGEILEHLEDPMSFLRDCRDLLTNDGVLILSTPNPHSPMP